MTFSLFEILHRELILATETQQLLLTRYLIQNTPLSIFADRNTRKLQSSKLISVVSFINVLVTNSWWICFGRTMTFCSESSTQRAGSRSRDPSNLLVVFYDYFICNKVLHWSDYLISSSVHRRYVDDTLRIGRDDKGNIFILERSEDESLWRF